MTDSLIAWFGNPAACATAVAGGKGASLSRMTAAGFPVPSGFVVCAGAFRAFLDQFNGVDLIQSLTEGLDVHDEASLAAVSQQLRGLILSNPLPGPVSTAIRDGYSEFAEDCLVAVRSSAVAEDGAAASFAGQQETFLNVRGLAAVRRYVQECWVSLFAPRALFYRALKGTLTDIHMAVVVQEMVPAEKSGVLFTVDPVEKRRDHMMIEAIFGLGEGIVSGLITPDHYVLDRDDGSVVRQFIAPQFIALAYDSATGTTAEIAVPEEQGMAQVLNDGELRRLLEMGRQLESHFEAPQDIEWCIKGTELYLLQSRPITTL
jgi:phosphoenolpyruvate synthase/pyruvate phosphate dikinase